MSKRIRAGVGASAGAILAVPAAAQAEDFRVTNLNDSGAGSLREAIANANADAAADRILFKSKLSGTIELDLFLGIFEPVQIIGPGARRVTIDADGSPLFSIGASPGDAVAISGLTLHDGANLGGGAISSGDADLRLSGLAITNGYAGLGGGIFASGGDVTIEHSTISGSRANSDGGGIFVSNGELSILSSTISGNTAGDDGGGVYVYDNVSSPALELRNSTVTGNTAANEGGGIAEDVPNVAGTLRGSIVAGNNAVPSGFGYYDDLEGSTWEISFSLVGRDSDPAIDDQGGNIFDVDPKLKPLNDNGGPTDTHAFKKSPAKNKGPSDSPNSDQRGAPRKGKPDIGAYELTKCKGVIVNRVGTAGKDKLKGTKKKDGILGLGGNDKLSGKKGKDGLCGGQGKDKLKGGPGKDKLVGGPGKDKLDGGPGKDKEVQ